MNLVIGASGQVGHHLMKVLPDAVGTYYQHASEGLRYLDITDGTAVEKLIYELNPDVIYLPAGQVNADYCEKHIAETDLVNIQGVLNVVQSSRAFGAKLVYFSSDYLFDGQDGAYSEDAETRPLNVYGRQKMISEMIIRNTWRVMPIIIRTSGVFSWEPQGKNFVMRLVNDLRRGIGWAVTDDQIGSPTYAPYLAQTVIELVNKGATGIYNVAGLGYERRYRFAREIAYVFGLDKDLITPVSTEALGQVAKRPLNGGLSLDKAEKFLGHPLQHYLTGLQAMVQSEAISV